MEIKQYEKLKELSKDSVSVLAMRNEKQEAVRLLDIEEIKYIIKRNKALEEANIALSKAIKKQLEANVILGQTLDLMNDRLVSLEIEKEKGVCIK